MIRSFGCLLCLAGLTVAPMAQAETWVPLAQGTGSTLSLDRDSVTSADGRTRYVSRMLYAVPQSLTDEKDKPATYTELRNQMDMDCAARTQSPLSGRFYDASGNLVAEIITPLRPQPIVVGSSADWEYKAVCTAPAPETSAQALP